MKPRRATARIGWLVLGLAFLVASCDFGLGPDQGRVRFVLTSGGAAAGVAGAATATVASTAQVGQDGAQGTPSLDSERDHDYRAFQAANVTFSSILARNQDGVLVDVDMDLPVQVDVVRLDTGGNEVSLPDGDLPPGTYDQLVVVMTQVEAVLKDNTQVAITPPGGGWTAIVPLCAFTVEDGGTTTVSLQFMVRQSFAWQNARYHFQPQLRCDTGSGDSTQG